MNYFLDVFPNDCLDNNTLVSLDQLRETEGDMSGPCEDDYELTCELMYYLPAESNHEQGSPLNFASETYGLLTDTYIDEIIEKAYLEGI